MKKIILLGITNLMPTMALAARNPGVNEAGTIFSIAGTLTAIINYIAPALVTIAVIFFIVTVIQYSFTTDEDKKGKAKKGIVSALIGIFVISSFWGIIALVQRSFGIEASGEQQLKEVGDIWGPLGNLGNY